MAYYDRYRGSRRRRQNRIKTLLLVLLLLVVIGLAALFVLQETAIFTHDGFRFPFARQEEDPAQDPDDGEDIKLEIQDPQPNVSQPVAPSDPVTEPLPEPVELPRTAALLADGNLLLTDKAGLLRQFSETGVSQLAFVVKTPDGISLVDDDDVSDGVDPQSAVFALELDSLEVGKIAVISALRDNVRPRTTHRGSSLKLESGSTWLDREYMAWFDPAGEDTLACLLATVRACEAAGFEQVVLENFCYPTAGKLELITMPDSAGRVQALTQLANQLRDGTHMALGLLLTQEAAANLTDNISGQDVSALAPFFDRMYAPGGFDADLSALDSAAEGTQCEIGLYVSDNGQAPADFDRNFIQIP